MVDTQNAIMVKQQQDNEKLQEMILKNVKENDELKATINELRAMLADKNNKSHLLMSTFGLSNIKA